MAKRTADVGTLYKGSPGQWSWLLHRITGVAVILFLFAHVVDTAVVGWGPEAYNRVVSVYHNWVVKLLELGLVAAVLVQDLLSFTDPLTGWGHPMALVIGIACWPLVRRWSQTRA